MRSIRALRARLVAVFALTACAVGMLSSAPSDAQVVSDSQVVVVVLKDSVTSPDTVAARHAKQYGVKVRGVYSHALKGYAGELSPEQLALLQADPDVELVEPDLVLQIDDQVVPTGIRRVFADDNPTLDIAAVDAPAGRRIDADVAVIDTGVMAHPDLNVASRADCSSGVCEVGIGNDDNGHGTHVAGTIAALDNGIGVVGVAPGARIHSVKVCDAHGSCPNSAIVAAVDYVTANADIVEIVNMSLGGPGVNPVLARAIERSVDAGVVYSVSAGNASQDARDFAPANHPDVITVSALADSDGDPGGTGGAPWCRRQSRDDQLADFSNFGEVVDVAAPGVCITSTWNDGGTHTLSGTSMAAPHVAGAAAILASGPSDPTDRADVLAIKQQIVNSGNHEWTDNSGDTVEEPLLDIHDATQFPVGAARPALGGAPSGGPQLVPGGPTPTQGEQGILAVRLEPVEGVMTEGFDVTLRFYGEDGEQLAEREWSDSVPDDAGVEASYTHVLREVVPVGVVRLVSFVRVSPGGSIPPPEGPGCETTVEVEPDDVVLVTLLFEPDAAGDCAAVTAATAEADQLLGMPRGLPAPGFVGLTHDQAEAEAEARGWKLRVVASDGESFILTQDYNAQRVNVVIEDDHVTAAVRG
jgi:subtilisin family serine protease